MLQGFSDRHYLGKRKTIFRNSIADVGLYNHVILDYFELLGDNKYNMCGLLLLFNML